EEKATAAQCPVVRTPGHLWVYLPQLDEKPRAATRSVRWTAGNRHLQYLVGAYALQHPFPRSRRACEKRRARGRRLSARIPSDVAGRDAAAPDRDALPQPGEHGCRGIDP